MALTRYAFESGANGDALTAANTGSTAVSITDGGSGSISTAQAAHGTRSVHMVAGTTSGTNMFYKDITLTDNLAFDAYIRIGALPTADTPVLWIGNGTTRYISANLLPNGKVRLVVNGVNVWDSTAVLTAGGPWYRFSTCAHRDTAAGTARFAVFTADTTTPISGADSGTLGSLNTGASQYARVRVGAKTTTGTQTNDIYIDDWGYDPAASTLNPPYGAVPPVIGTPSTDLNYARIDLSGVTYSVSAGVPVVTPSANVYVSADRMQVFVPRDPAGGTITYTVTAVDDGNGATAQTTVAVAGVAEAVAGHAELVTYDGTKWV